MRRVVLIVPAALLALTAPAGAGSADTFRPQQWGLDRIGATSAWSRATGAGVLIGVVDSGAALGHPDLAGKVAAHATCIGAEGDPERCHGSGADDNGHGTHVAGIAAAATGNGTGVSGVAPGARLVVARALADSCPPAQVGDCPATGSIDDISAAIRWSVDRGARVVNLSLGEVTQSVFGPAFVDAIRYAWSKGAVPVVATGNDVILPSGFSDEPAMVVAATTRDDGIASYSNGVGEAQWGLAAPGGESGDGARDCAAGGSPEGVMSTWWDREHGNGYACRAGTSMAAPHVSGALAVLLGAGLSPEQAVRQLLATARDLGPRGRDSTYGAGRLDLGRAVAGLPDGPGGGGGPGATPQPTVKGANPGGGGTGSEPTVGRRPGASAGTTDTSVGPSSSTTATSEPGRSRPPRRGGVTLEGAAGPAPGSSSDGEDRTAPAAVATAMALVSGGATVRRWLTSRRAA